MQTINSLIQNFKNQDLKQRILLVVLVIVAVITFFTIYINFLRPQPVIMGTTDNSQLKPLNLEIEILESDSFNSLKSNN